MAASVVDLPEPVGPVTSTMPRAWSEISAKILGAFRSSRDRIFEGIVRITAAAPRFCTKAFTRIMGGRPEDRCKSEALFLTTKAKSSEISTIIPFNVRPGSRPDDGPKQMKARGFFRLAALAPPALIMSSITANLQAVRQRIESAAQA